MKVLGLVPYLEEELGGPGRVALNLAGHMNNEAKVDLLTTSSVQRRRDEGFCETRGDGGVFIRSFYASRNGGCIYSPRLMRWFSDNIKNYDIVLTQTLFSPMITLAHRICAQKRMPFIATPHGMLEPWAMNQKPLKKRVYFELFESPFLNQASAICMVGREEARHALRLRLKPPLVIVPNGISKEELYQEPDARLFFDAHPRLSSKRIILYLARLHPKKGGDLLIGAFSELRKRYDDIHLVMAGPDEGGYRRQLEDLCERLGCADSVTFTGMLKGEMKNAAFGAARLFAAPAHSEGFSVSVLEAMGRGLPCVLSEGCNFPEAAAEKAAIVFPLSAGRMRDSIAYLLNHADEARMIGRRARQLILSEYSWEKSAKKMIDVIRAVLSQSAIPHCLSKETSAVTGG